MRRTEVSATPVMGPLVSGERMTSRNGARYSSGSTLPQSAGACAACQLAHAWAMHWRHLLCEWHVVGSACVEQFLQGSRHP